MEHGPRTKCPFSVHNWTQYRGTLTLDTKDWDIYEQSKVQKTCKIGNPSQFCAHCIPTKTKQHIHNAIHLTKPIWEKVNTI